MGSVATAGKGVSALQRRRLELKYSQLGLGRAVGKTGTWVSRLELGWFAHPDEATLKVMAKALKYNTVEELKRDIPRFPISPMNGSTWRQRADRKWGQAYLTRATLERTIRACRDWDRAFDDLVEEAVTTFLDNLEGKRSHEGQDTLSSESPHNQGEQGVGHFVHERG